MTRRKRAWLLALLAFFVCLPPAFFAGITLIGHARPVPYVSAWLDRLVLVATALGLPLLAGCVVHRFVSGRRIGTDTLPTALERAFPGRAKEAGAILVTGRKRTSGSRSAFVLQRSS